MKKVRIETQNGVLEIEEKYILYIRYHALVTEYHFTKEFFDQTGIRTLNQNIKVTVIDKRGTK